MKQKFKGKALSEKVCKDRILAFYHAATISEIKEGLFWYDNANKYCRELAARFDVSLSSVAGIIAAFSPQAGWQENKRYALSFLINPKNRQRSLVQDVKARAILKLTNEADIYAALSINNAAWKTKAFFLNILNPDLITDVTIDRHAIASCLQRTDKVEALDDSYGKITEKQYRFFEKCYVNVAIELDILPQQLQAIVWTVYRRLRELRQYDNNNVKTWQPFDSITF